MGNEDGKKKILKTLSRLNEAQLLEVMDIYCTREQEKKEAARQRAERTFDVCRLPDHVAQEIKRTKESTRFVDAGQLRWAETVEGLPTKTMPLPVLDAKFLRNAKRLWEEDVKGLEDVYETILLHVVEYLKTGVTRPLILIGAPGCGKTHVMKSVAKILGLPTYIESAQQLAASGNGLAGHSRSYANATPGPIVRAMMELHCGNPVLLIDEIDKVAEMNSLNKGNLQNELLHLTSDETRAHLTDSYLGFAIDASHMFIVMTANDETKINAPLMSRCDVIFFREPECQQIADILFYHSFPKKLAAFGCEKSVRMERQELDAFIDELYRDGQRDTRKYQSALETAVATAYLSYLSTEKPVTLGREHLLKAYRNMQSKKDARSRPIGFASA